MPIGYEKLIVYHQAVIIYDLNFIFCQQNLHPYKDKRTIEQMIQAARSGKQNIVEASLEKSAKLNIKLTAVARASLGELLEDYRDFLRINNLTAWPKDDPKIMTIRRIKIEPYKTYKAYTTYMSYLKQPETFANLMLTLIMTENYMLDKMINTLEQNFIRKGGYTENLATKRRDYRGF